MYLCCTQEVQLQKHYDCALFVESVLRRGRESNTKTGSSPGHAQSSVYSVPAAMRTKKYETD